MRKITFLLIVLSCIIFHTQAQVGTASIKLGEGEFAAAKTAIDKVMNNPKQTAKGKTWYVYGEVYYNIYVADPDLDADALSKALTGFSKAAELGHKAKDEEFFDYFRRLNVAAYLESNWEMVIDAGKEAITYNAQDTLVYMLVADAANKAEKFDVYEEFMDVLLTLDFTDKANYLALYGVYFKTIATPPNDAKSLELLEQAIALDPSDETAIQLMIMHDKLEDAISKIEVKLQEDPNNATYLYQLGGIYDQIENEEKAIEYYQKAIDSDPNHINALFNLGAIYNNKGAIMIEEYNNQGLDADEKLKEEGTALINQALPYFENLYNREDLDKETRIASIKVIMNVYSLTGRSDEYLKLEEELKNME